MPGTPSERDFADLARFCDEIRAHGLTTVVIAWQEEFGQDLSAQGVVYEQLAQFWLIAYHQPTSTIFRCHLQGGRDERRALAERLRVSGLIVEERDRNEVRFRTRG